MILRIHQHFDLVGSFPHSPMLEPLQVLEHAVNEPCNILIKALLVCIDSKKGCHFPPNWMNERISFYQINKTNCRRIYMQLSTEEYWEAHKAASLCPKSSAQERVIPSVCIACRTLSYTEALLCHGCTEDLAASKFSFKFGPSWFCFCNVAKVTVWVDAK